MKVVQLLVTTYLIFIYTNNSLALEKTERRKGSKNARKLSWRLKLLKKISGRIKRPRGVNRSRKDVTYGCIDEEKSLDYDVPVLCE